MKAFWAVPGVRERVSKSYKWGWRAFRNEPEYDSLRERIKQAIKEMDDGVVQLRQHP